MALRLFRRSQHVCHISSRYVSTKKDEHDMTFKELGEQRVVPLRDNSQLKPIFDHEMDSSKKTTVTVLNNKVEEGLLMINSLSPVGFRLNNGISIFGPLAIFPKTVFSWRVPWDIKHLTSEAFSLFYLLEPKIDVLVLGVGDKGKELDKNLLIYLLGTRKMSVEVLPTEHAVTTFNFLIEEGRNIAGAFYPPQKIMYSEDDFHFKFQTRSIEPDEDNADFSSLSSKKK